MERKGFYQETLDYEDHKKENQVDIVEQEKNYNRDLIQKHNELQMCINLDE